MTAVPPFTIHVPDEVLADQRERFARTRWPGEIPGAAWDYGTNLTYVKELVDYWRTQFDWRAQEAALNRFAHFRTTLDGMGIHFIHERGKGPNPLPLIISGPHRLRMSKIIPLYRSAAHGCLRRSSPLHAGLWLLGPYDQARHQRRSHRRPLGPANDRCAGLSALGGAGRVGRLGFATRSGIGMHTTSCRSTHGCRRRRRAYPPGSTGALATGRGRLCAYSGNQTPDSSLRAERLPIGASRLDCREVAHLERLRWGGGTMLHPRRATHHHHHLLGHSDDQLIHPAVRREPAQPLDSPARPAHRCALCRGPFSA